MFLFQTRSYYCKINLFCILYNIIFLNKLHDDRALDIIRNTAYPRKLETNQNGFFSRRSALSYHINDISVMYILCHMMTSTTRHITHIMWLMHVISFIFNNSLCPEHDHKTHVVVLWDAFNKLNMIFVVVESTISPKMTVP